MHTSAVSSVSTTSSRRKPSRSDHFWAPSQITKIQRELRRADVMIEPDGRLRLTKRLALSDSLSAYRLRAASASPSHASSDPRRRFERTRRWDRRSPPSSDRDLVGEASDLVVDQPEDLDEPAAVVVRSDQLQVRRPASEAEVAGAAQPGIPCRSPIGASSLPDVSALRHHSIAGLTVE
jgi:hypothetical protein